MQFAGHLRKAGYGRVGHLGLVGTAVVRRLRQAGYNNLLLHSRQELDLRNQAAVEAFLDEHRPDFVVLAASRLTGSRGFRARSAVLNEAGKRQAIVQHEREPGDDGERENVQMPDHRERRGDSPYK